jgi:hypothetical protein
MRAGPSSKSLGEKSLHGLLSNELTLQDVNLAKQEIVVSVDDQAQRPYQITLAVPDPTRGKADGHGQHFDFYLAATNTTDNRNVAMALLGIAALFDQVLPDSALAGCGGDAMVPAPQPEPAPASVAGSDTVPRVLTLISAMLQVLVVIAALWFGRRAIRRTDS